jgi:hypothetical protein
MVFHDRLPVLYVDINVAIRRMSTSQMQAPDIQFIPRENG